MVAPMSIIFKHTITQQMPNPTTLLTTLALLLMLLAPSCPSLLHQPPRTMPHIPSYTLTKLSYTNLTKTITRQIAACLASNVTHKYEIIPSISVHDGDSVSYPLVVRYCHDFFTLAGHALASFAATNYFVSSVRNQYTYFVEAVDNGQQDMTIIIKKLRNKNKRVLLQQEATLQVPRKYGQITSVANSFSLSLKLFAIATKSKHLFFYRLDGKLESHIDLSLDQPIFSDSNSHSLGLKMVKLNNYLAVYTPVLDSQAFLYTISTNGKNSTLKRYALPKFQPADGSVMQVKYNDNHWNQFYAKIGDRVYVYGQNDGNGKADVTPKHWYPLLRPDDQFYVAGPMLIVESQAQSPESQPIRIYYNLTTGTVSQFLTPETFCPMRTHIGTSSHGQTAQILCTFCNLSYECYSLSSTSQPIQSPSDYSDFSKFRVPLVLLSLGIVIFVSVARGKKSGKSIDQQKQQQMFMKQLETRDKSLYQQLKRTRKAPSGPPTPNPHQQ